MSENKVVDIKKAHATTKYRGGTITFAEEYARGVASGKLQSTPHILAMSVKYIMEVDLLRKKQRAIALSERRKSNKKKVVKVEEAPSAKESEITPELAKRLALQGFGGSDGHQG